MVTIWTRTVLLPLGWERYYYLNVLGESRGRGKYLKQTSVSGLVIEFIHTSAFPLFTGIFFFLFFNLNWRKSVYIIVSCFWKFSKLFLPCTYQSYVDFLFLVKNSRHLKQKASLSHLDNVFVEHSVAKEVLVHLYSEVIISLVCTVF